MTETSPPAAATLIKQNIPHSIFRHTGQVTSLEQAAAERGQRPEQVIRSIVFRLEEGQFAMVCVAGPKQISWPALRTYFGKNRLSMASPEEVIAATGYRIGTVSPFGLATEMPVLLDESVLLADELSLGSGQSNTAIVMTKQDLIKALGEVQIGMFTV